MACWDFIRSTVVEYIKHLSGNCSLLHYLADLFKLFILLNYVYFAYMIFAQLFHLLNDYFERRKCQKLPSYPDQFQKESRRESRRPPCTCVRSNEPPPPEEPKSCATSICNLFSKSKTRSKSSEKLACSSSVERIQVEFNCKAKKSKKTREGRVPKSRSCTKCGKNLTDRSCGKTLTERSSKCTSRGGVSSRRRRGGNCSDSEDEFGLRR